MSGSGPAPSVCTPCLLQGPLHLCLQSLAALLHEWVCVQVPVTAAACVAASQQAALMYPRGSSQGLRKADSSIKAEP